MTVIVSRDIIRQSFGVVGKGVLSTEDERTVTGIEMDLLRRSISEGRSVIVDNTNLDTRRASQYATEAHILGVEFEEINLYEAGSDDLYVSRSDIPENIVLRQIRSAKKMTPLEPRVELIKPLVPSGDVFQPACFIFDIDGTLANSDGLRSPYDYSRVQFDKPYEDLIYVAEDLSVSGSHIVIVSGRDEECREQTVNWLDNQGVRYNKLFMRKHRDTRHDAQVKYEIARDLIVPNYYIRGVFDDRTRIVNCWRSMGIRTYQVKGYFESDF